MADRGTPGRGAVSVSLGERYGCVLLDIDGVIRRGTASIAGAGEAIRALRDRGVPIGFVTNNASATPEELAERLREVAVDVDPAEIVTSAMAAAAMLDPGTACLVIGMDGLRRALTGRGCRLVEDPDRADAVVVGLDRNLTWDDLRRATVALRAGARFVATNDDATFPAADGLWPGNGAVVAALERSAGRPAEVAGKPHPPLLRVAAERIGGAPVLFVGDRHETDVVGAAALGWDTALVLTGVTRREEVAGLTPGPTYVLESVVDLLAPVTVDRPRSRVVVRTAGRGDVAGMVRLWDLAGMLPYTPEPERDIELVMAGDADLQVVAEVNEAIVGVAVGTFDGRRGWLMRVAVEPAARRQGIARAMVATLENRMRARGVPQIDLLTFDDNLEARAFWEGIGYRKTGPVALYVKGLKGGDAAAC